MLDTVLFARDKWLVPGGVVHPDKSSMYLVAMGPEDHAQHVRFWDRVYDFKMTTMKQVVVREADVCFANGHDLISAPYAMRSLDMHTVQIKDLQFTAPFTLVINKAQPLSAICSYFDILFEQGCDNPVYFSTGPEATPTHWKQTVFYIEPPISVAPGDVVDGELVCRRQKHNTRALVVNIKFMVMFGSGADSAVYAAKYFV
jgi:hypothetical protein